MPSLFYFGHNENLLLKCNTLFSVKILMANIMNTSNKIHLWNQEKRVEKYKRIYLHSYNIIIAPISNFQYNKQFPQNMRSMLLPHWDKDR